MSEKRIFPRVRINEIVVRSHQNEVLIYDLKTNKAYCLNETSAAVWRLCNGKRSISEIAIFLQNNLGVPISKDFVCLAIQQFETENLSENGDDRQRFPGDISRRKLIRRIGSTSLAALPLITSIVAPPASNSQSQNATCPDRQNNSNAGANGCDCAGADDCQSNCCGFSPMVGQNACAAFGNVAPNLPCRAGCECSSGTCTGSPRMCA